MLPTLTFVLSLAVSLILLQAGVSKLRSPEDYRPIISRYLGFSAGRWISLLVGVIEIDTAVALLLPPMHQYGLIAAALVIGGYALGMARLWFSGVRDARCGCAGPASETLIGPELMLRNSALALALAGAATLPVTLSYATLAWVPVLGAGVLLFVLWHVLDTLISNAQKLRGLN